MKDIKYYKFIQSTMKMFKGFKAPFGLDGVLPKEIEIEPLPEMFKPENNKKAENKENNISPDDLLNQMKGLNIESSNSSQNDLTTSNLEGTTQPNKKIKIEVLASEENYDS